MTLPDLTDEQKAQCAKLGLTFPEAGDAIEAAMELGIALGQQTARDVQAEPVASTHSKAAFYDWWQANLGKYPDAFGVAWGAYQAALAAPPASDVQPVGAVAVRIVGAVNGLIGFCEGVFGVMVMEDAKRWQPTMDRFRDYQDRIDAALAAAPALQGESGATFAEGIEAAAKLADYTAPHVAEKIRALAPQPTQSGATVADQRDAAQGAKPLSMTERLATWIEPEEGDMS